jgi:hypothetical protein
MHKKADELEREREREIGMNERALIKRFHVKTSNLRRASRRKASG